MTKDEADYVVGTDPGKFWLHGVRFAGIHLTIVRNDFLFLLARSSPSKRFLGWFLVWDHRWLCGTLRVGPICFNIDVDWR